MQTKNLPCQEIGNQALVCPYLSRGEANADAEFVVGFNDGLAVINDAQSVLEERRLDWNEVLECRQRQRLVDQLPVGAGGQVAEDELMWIGHEVVLVEFIANTVRRHLASNNRTSYRRSQHYHRPPRDASIHVYNRASRRRHVRRVSTALQSKCQTPLYERAHKHVVQHVVGLLASVRG